MEGLTVADFTDRNRYMRKSRWFLLFLFFILISVVVGVSLTRDNTSKKAQKIIRQQPRTKNLGCKVEKINSLRKSQSSGLKRTIKEYYRRSAETKDFIDSYEDLDVYIKDGECVNTYVVFVTYQMKIRGAYTKLPGLGTLYVKETAKGVYGIWTEQLKKETRSYIHLLASHTDVKKMMKASRRRYEQAVRSDALLRESLTDLKKALN